MAARHSSERSEPVSPLHSQELLMARQSDSIIEKLDSLRGGWWLFTTLCRLISALIVSLLVLSIFVLVDMVTQFPLAVLRILFALWCLVSIGLSAAMLISALRNQRSLSATARRVELTFPELGNSLITLVQMKQSPDTSNDFYEAAMDEAARQASNVPVEQTASHQNRWWRLKLGLQTPLDLVEFTAAFVLVVALLWCFNATSPSWSASTERILRCWTPPVTSHQFEARGDNLYFSEESSDARRI